MNAFNTFVLLMYIAVLIVGVAQKRRISYPIALVIGGSLLGFIPGLTLFDFDPHILIMTVLPPILFYASYSLSFKEFIFYFSDIFSLAIGLVIATTIGIGFLFKWLFPELSWSLAFAFGAIISPPDAVATTAILKSSSINSRLRTILEGESLINDASALVIYRFAVLAIMTENFHLKAIIPEVFYVVGGGILIGLSLGYIFSRISDFLFPPLAVVHSFTIPYMTYCLANFFNVSAVLAVVTCGLLGARILITRKTPLMRVLAWASWDLFIILLNCFIFILIGLKFRQIIEKMSWDQIWIYSGYGVLITLAIFFMRFAWIYFRRLVWHFRVRKDYHKVQQSKIYLRYAVISSWAGMRGIVSLIAALALPLNLPNGMPLQGREIVIFLTFQVIFLTLVIPGLTLPLLIRWLKVQTISTHEEVLQVRKELTEVAKKELDQLHLSKHLDNDEHNLLSMYFNSHGKLKEISSISEEHKIEKARHHILQKQREHLMQIWLSNKINDNLMHELERELDIEESHLIRGEI